MLEIKGFHEDVNQVSDQLLPQPPPDAPAPPPSEAALRSRTKTRWLLRIGLVSSGYLIVMLILKLTLGADHGNGHTELAYAKSNVRQLGLALMEFETEYGKFPDGSTVVAVRKDTGTKLTLPDRTSNDLFAQLLVVGFAGSESIFYARADAMRTPDNVFNSDATILAHGECAFAYISGLSAAGDPSTPLVFGPVIPGTATFDKKSCVGKAFILRKDNSVTELPIDASGKAIINGLDLLDPRQPFWHGKVPDVKWPK